MRRFQTLAIMCSTAIVLNACAFDTTPAAPTAVPSVSSIAAPTETPRTAGMLDATTVPGAAERVTITFAAFEEQRAVYAPLIATFEHDNPAIHVQFVPLDPLFRSGEPSDRERALMSAADTTAEPMTASAVMKGYVRDLTPLIDADASFDRADFYPGVLDSVSQARGIYMVPRAFRVPLLFYNKDLWAARGVPTPKPDWTWADLLAAAEQLAQKRGDAVQTYGLLDWGASGALFGELTTAGIRRDPAQQQRLDDPKIVAVVEHVAGLMRSGAILSAYGWNLTHAGGFPVKEIGDLIRNGQVGIWSPDLCCYDLGTTPPSFAIGMMPLPAPVFADFTAVEGYAMSGGTQHPEAAWRWLAFLSHQEVARPVRAGPELSLAETTLPARKSVAERIGRWRKLNPELATAIKALLDSPAAQRLVGLTPPPIFDDVDFEELLMSVMQGQKTVRAALAEAQRTREQRLAQRPPVTPTPGSIVVASPLPEAASSATTITFGAPSFAIDQIRRLVASFNVNHPEIFVMVKDISPTTAGQVTSSGRTRPLAEVAATTDCFTFFGPPDPGAITATLDLQPLLDADASVSLDDYPAALLAPFRRATALYALPDAVYFRVLHYNQTAFDAAGLAQPTATWTLDDFLNAAQRLTSGAGNDKRYGFGSLGGQTREVFFFLDRRGAAETSGSGDAPQPQFTDPKVVQAVRAYLDLLRTASPHTHLQGYRRDDQRDDAYGLIAAGRVGMWWDFGLGFLGGASQPGFTHAIAPPPLGASGITTNDFIVRGLAISARTEQRDACWTWLKYLSNDVSTLRDGFPARRSLAESDAFTKQAPPEANAIYQGYRVALDRASNEGHAVVDRDQSPIDYYWFFRAIDRALQGKDLDRELADAQTLTEQYLACVQAGAAASVCAIQVDPDYQGWRNASPEPERP